MKRRDDRMTGRVYGTWAIRLAPMLMAGMVHAVTMDEAVEAALEHSPGLQAARHRVEAARSAATQAEAAYYPTVFLSGNISRTDNPTHAFMTTLNQRALEISDPTMDFNDPDDADNLRLTAGMRYRLYDGGQRRATQNMMHLGVEAKHHATEAFQNTLIYLVKEGYYHALKTRDFVAVREETVTSLEESLRVARERFEAGSAVITDVLNLEVQVAQAREELIRAKHNFEMAISTLNTAIGTELLSMDRLTSPDDEPSRPSADPVQLSDHPQLSAAAAMLDIRRQDVRRARGAYAPTLNAFGTLDWDSDVTSDFERSYMVGVMAEWEIFDGFRKRGALRESRSRRAETEATYEQVRNDLSLDLRQAHTRAIDAYERLAVTRTSKESAEKALAITREQYEQGAATLSDLLTAQSGLTATQTRQTAAYYDYLTALANRDRAQGHLIHKHRRTAHGSAGRLAPANEQAVFANDGRASDFIQQP